VPTLTMPRMRGRSAHTCRTCDAVWHERGARFCGNCGGNLTTARDPRTSRAGASSVSGRRWHPDRIISRGTLIVVGVVALAGTVIATAVLVAGSSMSLPGLPRAVEEAEIAAPDPTAGAERLGDRDPDQAAALRDAVDPARLRCEPEGCEVWRLAGVRPDPWQPGGAGSGDRLAQVVGSDVVVLDLRSGDEVLRVTLPELDEATIGSTIGPGAGARALLVDDRIAVLVDDLVIVLDGEGAELLRIGVPGASDGFVAPYGDNLLLAQPMFGGSGGDHVSLVDTRTGEIVLSRHGASALLHGSSDDVLLLSIEPGWDAVGARLAAVDAVTGEELWSRSRADTRHAWPMPLGEHVLLRSEPRFYPDGTDDAADPEDGLEDTAPGPDDVGVTTVDASELIELRTGRSVLTIDGPVISAAAPDGSLVLVTASPEDTASLWGHDTSQTGTSIEVTISGLDGSGVERFSVPVEVRVQHGCCVDLWSDAEGVRLQTLEDAFTVDVATGDLTPVEPAEDRVWVDPQTGLTMDWHPGRVVLSSEEFGSVHMLSDEIHVVAVDQDVVVVAGPRDLMGVRLQRPG
jgi:hypothetical protein